MEKPDTSTRALQALSELNKTVSEFDDVCEQIAEHEDQDNVGVSKNLTEASKIIHNCRILAKGLRTRPQHSITEKSTSQAKIKQEQEAQNQQELEEESSTVQSRVGPVQDTTVQSSHGNIQGMYRQHTHDFWANSHAAKLKFHCSTSRSCRTNSCT